VTEYLINHLAFSNGRIFSVILSIKKINFPQFGKYQILIFLRRLQITQLNARPHQLQQTDRSWLLRVKKINEWRCDGDGSSAQFIVTGCCNGPLCVVELVHALFYTLISELYVIWRYVFIHIYTYIQLCDA